MSVVRAWTGLESRLLRLARRMSVREFADHLGVSSRMVSKWEADGRNVRPRDINQAALDESLRRCSETERQLFHESRRIARGGLREQDTPVRLCVIVELAPEDIGLIAAITATANEIIAANSTGTTPTS